MFRAFLDTVNWDRVWIMIFIDASPQWRGVELFAGSFDMISHGIFRYCARRLFPQIQIGPLLYTVLGKCFALLWQVWLVAGPDIGRMRAFTDRVRSFCTDLGAERSVFKVPDLLPDFCRHIGVAVPRSYVRRQFLFPNAMLVTGWHHVFDGVVRFGMFSLKWFPSFLNKLKLMVKFFRNALPDLLDALHVAGFGGAAVVSCTPPPFRIRFPTTFVFLKHNGNKTN